MTTVQIAIRNRSYARALRDLLVADGQHRVYLVAAPNSALDGIVVTDEHVLERLAASDEVDLAGYIVFVERLDFDANRLFQAGVRHVIHADAPPHVGRLIVIGAERSPNHGSSLVEGGIFTAADQLFLQALRIDGR
jgi:hypothetical protein